MCGGEDALEPARSVVAGQFYILLHRHIRIDLSLFEKEFIYKPTEGQKLLIDRLSEFVVSNKDDEIFLIKGYAGTGKTTIVSVLVNVLDKLKLKTVLLAPTGRAAKVLTSYSGKNAYTIHKKIYRQKSSIDRLGKFSLDHNKDTNTIFIVDEASMISNFSYESNIFGSGRLLDDLIEYVYSCQNCPTKTICWVKSDGLFC